MSEKWKKEGFFKHFARNLNDICGLNTMTS